VSQYQKGKTNLDFTEARDSEWQWHQLGHMQVCISLRTDNHASTPPLSFLQTGCPSCRPTNSVKALKAEVLCKSCIIIINFFLTPVLNSQAMKKLHYAIQKSTKIKLNLDSGQRTLPNPPPSQNYRVVRWHCTTESTCLLLFLLSVHRLGGLRLCPAF